MADGLPSFKLWKQSTNSAADQRGKQAAPISQLADIKCHTEHCYIRASRRCDGTCGHFYCTIHCAFKTLQQGSAADVVNLACRECFEKSFEYDKGCGRNRSGLFLQYRGRAANIRKKRMLLVQNAVKKLQEGQDANSLVSWKPDVQVLQCRSCGYFFSAFRRRHHCRFCGDIFCGACTSHVSIELTIGSSSASLRSCEVCAGFLIRLKSNATAPADAFSARLSPLYQAIQCLIAEIDEMVYRDPKAQELQSSLSRLFQLGNDVLTLARPPSLHQMKVTASIKRRVDAYIEETKIATLAQIGLNSIKVP